MQSQQRQMNSSKPLGKKMGEKRRKSKTPVIYQVVVHGDIPEKIRERLSTIHAQAILKANNRVTSNVGLKAAG